MLLQASFTSTLTTRLSICALCLESDCSFRRLKKSDNMDIKSETSTVLDLPPSAVAFCPSHPEFYVVGTYFLHPKKETDESKGEESSEEAPQKRTGTLILYRLEGSVL